MNREAREQEELAKYRAERPKIQQQFSDLKRGLSSVTDEEWENIPEVGNLTRRKRRRDERSFVVPDSVVVGDRAKGEYENSLDPMQQEVSRSPFPAWASTDLSRKDWWSRHSCGLRLSYEFRRNRSSPRQDSFLETRPGFRNVHGIRSFHLD